MEFSTVYNRPGGVIGLRGDGYVRAKIENRTFERTYICMNLWETKFLQIWDPLRDFFLNFGRSPKTLYHFFEILVDFYRILVEISGNRDPLRGKRLIFVVFWPFKRLTWMNFCPFERLLRYEKGTPMGRTYTEPLLPKYPRENDILMLIFTIIYCFKVKQDVKNKSQSARYK